MSRLTPSLLKNTLTIILAGGQGERLYPLTKERSKPSVPFAANYRIIDFTLSNCINSGLRQLYILTQYKAQSLNQHIRHGWSILQPELGEVIEIIPPQLRMSKNWYQGTADAIYQNIYLLEELRPEKVLILSGDHIYRMDYYDLLCFHEDKGAQVTLASFEYPREQSTGFGVIHVDETDKVISFIEKPPDPPAIPGKPDRALVNMGIYVFDTKTLVRALIEDAKNERSSHDLGHNIFPKMIEQKSSVYAYSFNRQSEDPYWRDVGTIDSYFEATMHLLDPEHRFDLISEDWPFRTNSLQMPPSRLNLYGNAARIEKSMVSAGCNIEGEIVNCMISPHVTVGENCHLENCVVFHDVVIGKNCKIRNAIIDKKSVIPDGCEIGYDRAVDEKQFLVSPNHVVVVPKNMHMVKPENLNSPTPSMK